MTIVGQTSDSIPEARHARIHRRAIIRRLIDDLEELRALEEDGPEVHAFLSQDGVYCIKCALPLGNWRHGV